MKMFLYVRIEHIHMLIHKYYILLFVIDDPQNVIYVFQIINIQEIESSMHALLLKQAMILMKRRQDELKHQSTYLQQLPR